ncbi:Hsp70 family protein [Clostridium sp.]|uniref:Hsp70 family protein n=1 Tax=Clostridium sp. TaxID=1506 RepID=UPI003464A3AF
MAKIGIDLGTSNSLVAYWDGNESKVIPNVFGKNLTPSVVGIDDNGNILIGEIAKERLMTHPNLTASVFKRFMGTEKVYSLGRYDFSPVELSSFILKSLKDDAESYLGEPCEEVIISVPAYFNNKQRQATLDAATLAGMKVENLISEPTAAAIAYGLHEAENESTFMVIDLGGGTFDVSILELFDGVMQVLAISGDNFLGGEDFTKTIISDFIRCNNLDEVSMSEKEYLALYKKAESCKKDLSKENIASFNIKINKEEFSYTLDKNKFSKICEDIISRMRVPIGRALSDVNISPKNIDSVVLIGGSTKMPIIRSFISKFLGKIPFTNINPDEAVGIGTAINSALKERHENLSEIILTDVCPYTLGTEVVQTIGGIMENGYFMPIIERNTTIPVSRVETLYTVIENQEEVRVDVYQGESRKVSGNLKLGELSIKMPPGPKGQELDVRYTYDKNAILEVIVTIKSTGEEKRLVIENSPGSMSEEEIEEKLSLLKDIKMHPRDRSEYRLILARAERLYEESLGDKRKYIETLIMEFEGVLNTQIEHKIKKAAFNLNKILNDFEGRLNF